MNHFVPDFETDDDYTNSISSSLNLPRKPIMAENDEDDLMELLWHNGQVVLHNQSNHRFKKPPGAGNGGDGGGGGGGGGEAPPPVSDQNLFIQEDEMSSWLHYPLREDDFCSDLFNSVSSTSQPQHVSNAPNVLNVSTAPNVLNVSTAPNVSNVSTAPNVFTAPNVSIATNVSNQTSQITSAKPPVRNFINFSRFRGNLTGGKIESGPSISKSIVRESTQVNPSESDVTRVDVNRETVNCGSSSDVAGENAFNFAINRKGKAVATATTTAATGGEISGASSSVISKADFEPVYVEPATETTIVNEKKRKEREAIDETESRSEETRAGRGSTSTKRSRAAEVHNLSERKRRDRINERMKALQELIPRCNKSDKASMLDEAIEYMKSLQLQIQMMSMGCGMMPMMYMPHHMAMSMNQHPPPPPFIPYPPNILSSQRPNNIATQQQSQIYLGGGSGPSRFHHQATTDHPMYNQYMNHHHHHYQQFTTPNPTQQFQFQFQNQESSQPSSSRPNSSKESKDQGRS